MTKCSRGGWGERGDIALARAARPAGAPRAHKHSPDKMQEEKSKLLLGVSPHMPRSPTDTVCR